MRPGPPSRKGWLRHERVTIERSPQRHVYGPPEPAPRMSRTPGRIQSAPTEPGADSVDVLRAWGFDTTDIDRLIADGVVRQPESAHIRERT